jgi:hypothetical protein
VVLAVYEYRSRSLWDDKQKSNNGKSNDKSEIQGSFAALRMTT